MVYPLKKTRAKIALSRLSFAIEAAELKNDHRKDLFVKLESRSCRDDTGGFFVYYATKTKGIQSEYM